MKFPNLHWRVSHGAGAFPDISDRFLLGFPKDAEEARRIYATRFWYDSAGPVYPRQIKGLLAHDVPISQMVFGTVGGNHPTHGCWCAKLIQGLSVWDRVLGCEREYRWAVDGGFPLRRGERRCLFCERKDLMGRKVEV